MSRSHYTFRHQHHISSSKIPSSHVTSSAFSTSATPDEDWTKISDLAERRRIQNRIAQRNYRKKLKRRLEDLERKTTSPSPEQSHAELASSTASRKSAKDTRSKSDSRRQSPTSCTTSKTQSPPELVLLGNEFSDFDLQDSSFFTSPLIPSYSSCLRAMDCRFDVQAMAQVYPDIHFQSLTLPTLAPTLPSMIPSDVHASIQISDDLLDTYSMPYAPMIGTDMWLMSEESEAALMTPSLSSSYSSDSSDGSSFSYFALPLSPPASPDIPIFYEAWT